MSSTASPRKDTKASMSDISEKAEKELEIEMIRKWQEEEEEEEEDDERAKWNCNQIRTKLNHLFQSGKVVKSHWLKENGVNSNSYGRFMKLKGPFGGSDNGTFWAANAYFKKMEEAEKKMPAAEKKRKREEEKVESNKKRKVGNEFLEKMAAFPYKEEGPIYDDCNEIRRKINAFLPEGIVKKTEFCRGGSSGAYPAAYHFFEKKRLMEGKPKSKTRTEAEATFPNGHELHHDNGMRLMLVGMPYYEAPSHSPW